MLCKNPYVKTQTGITRMHCVMSKDARDASTPFPCGRCLNCKINKSREYTVRLMLENMVSADSLFLTLTYDNEHLPEGGNLVPKHLKNFIQTFRRHNCGQKIRYFAVGEYGDTSWRPHYHLAVFSNDRLRRQSQPKGGFESVGYAWNKGHSMCGDITKDSARYITGYVTKKVTRPYYQFLGDRHPEFMRSSKHGGGIGAPAIKRIGEQLRQNEDHNKRVIRELRVGSQVLPLGRYLTKKLSDEIGVDENTVRNETYDYQFQIIDRYIDNTNLLGALLHDTESKRESKEKRFKIYSKKRSI